MIDQIYLMLFNMFFTSWTPVGWYLISTLLYSSLLCSFNIHCYFQFAVGMFDQDAPAPLLISSPELYYVGSDSTQYKKWSFWISTLEALWSSLVVFFIAFGNMINIFVWMTLELWPLLTTRTIHRVWCRAVGLRNSAVLPVDHLPLTSAGHGNKVLGRI